MPFARRSLIDAVADRFGWCRACDTTTEVEAVLAEQTETAYSAAAVHAHLATVKNRGALHVQLCVLDVRRRVLAHRAALAAR